MRELPPTAGLPLQWRDMLPWHGDRDLEACLGRILGVDEVQITCSGTAGLVIALTTLARDSRRSEVIVPAYTCPLVAMAVAHCGLRLRVCDLQADGLGMEPAMLQSSCGPHTLAIIATHLCGRVADIAAALECAARSGARVIEDAAQALGARHGDGTPAGMLGDIGFYSLAAGKGLSMYEGGALVCRHAGLRVKLRQIAMELAPRNLAWEARRTLQLLGYAAFYRPRGLPLVYGIALRNALKRHDPESAAGDVFAPTIPLHRVGRWRQAVAARSATRLPAHIAAIRSQAQRRVARLRQIAGVEVMDDTPGAQGVWPVLLLRLSRAVERDAALSRLWGAGIGIGVPFAHALPDYAPLLDIVPRTSVPNAREFASRVLTISNTPWLDDATFARIVGVIETVSRSGMEATASAATRQAPAATPS